jgi:hypothetical protein
VELDRNVDAEPQKEADVAKGYPQSKKYLQSRGLIKK